VKIKKNTYFSLFTAIFSILIITINYLISYITWSFAGIPLGWDTSTHMARALLMNKVGPWPILKEEDFINMLYSLIMSPFAFFGLNALYMYESTIPLLLTVFLLYLTSRFPGIKNSIAKGLVLLSFSSWPIIYRFIADLHPALFGTVFSFAAVNILLNKPLHNKYNRVTAFKLFILILLASLAHIETANYFILSAIFASFIKTFMDKSFKKDFSSVIKKSYIFLPIFVIDVLYFKHLNKLMSLSSAGQILKDPTVIIGGFVFVTAYMLLLSYLLVSKRVRSTTSISLYYLICLSTIVFVSFILVPIYTRIYPYFERALITFPYPLVIGTLLEVLLSSNVKRTSWRLIVVVSLSLCLAFSSVIIAHNSRLHLRTWITKEAYSALLIVNPYCENVDIAIFVFYDLDQYAGGLAYLYDSWITLLCGKHYSYLGTVDNLLNGSTTVFFNVFSKEASIKFYNRLMNDQIIKKIRECNDDIFIIIVKDFYRAEIPQNFEEVSSQIYIAQVSKLCHDARS